MTINEEPTEAKTSETVSTTPPETPGTTRLPDVAIVKMNAPLHWLARGLDDFMKAPGPCLVYGVALAALSALLTLAVFYSGYAKWIMVLAGGFLFVAPMMAMGLYYAGKTLEEDERPRLGDMLFVKKALTRDLAYLGLALLIVYSFWFEAAQIIYGLSTYRVHDDMREFMQFLLFDPEGQTMAMTGTVFGGVIAFMAYSLIVISAPMLLDRRSDAFVATITSVRSVTRNFGPMLLWACIIVGLTIVGIATAFLGLILVFPVIGLASWRAYRDLVPQAEAEAEPA